MSCKKHTSDLSNTVGVCATCLRERLTSLLQAQAQAQAHAQLTRVASRSSDECSRNSSIPNPNNPPPPLIFPRSVSGRKSDYAAAWDGSDRRENLFYTTPQVGPTFYADGKRWKKRLSKFWIFSTVFRSRSEKLLSDPSCKQSSSASPSWFLTVFPDRRKNRDLSGMSPARTENFAGEFNQTPSASGCSSESSPRWRRTPSIAAGTNSTRRSRLGLAKSVSESGMAFSLSPLVRLSHKGLTPEMAAAKPHLSTAASFCANRSRKVADFGKVNYNR